MESPRPSADASVAFSRGSLGRISSIADPNRALISYAYYSGSGDLICVPDRAQNTTTFGYDPLIANHFTDEVK